MDKQIRDPLKARTPFFGTVMLCAVMFFSAKSASANIGCLSPFDPTNFTVGDEFVDPSVEEQAAFLYYYSLDVPRMDPDMRVAVGHYRLEPNTTLPGTAQQWLSFHDDLLTGVDPDDFAALEIAFDQLYLFRKALFFSGHVLGPSGDWNEASFAVDVEFGCSQEGGCGHGVPDLGRLDFSLISFADKINGPKAASRWNYCVSDLIISQRIVDAFDACFRANGCLEWANPKSNWVASYHNRNTDDP